VFGSISIAVIVIGTFVINRHYEDGTENAIMCKGGNEWISQTISGAIFLALNQFLILMQINFCIFVLIKIPHKQGVFVEDHTHHFKSGMQQKLL